MIRTVGNKVILYSKSGKKKLGEWGFKTGKGKKLAKTKAKNREKQILYFKNRKG